MTRQTLAQMAEEIWQTRKHLKYDPISLDEIAEGEFEAGYIAGAQAALGLPEVLAMRETLAAQGQWFIAVIAAFDRLSAEVGEVGE